MPNSRFGGCSECIPTRFDKEKLGKKELKKIEQKSAEWSEEDEEHYKACLQYFDEVKPDMVYYKDYQWLKSLRPQNNWKPSDEQIGVIEALIENRSFQRRHLVSLYEQLKKLKEK